MFIYSYSAFYFSVYPLTSEVIPIHLTFETAVYLLHPSSRSEPCQLIASAKRIQASHQQPRPPSCRPLARFWPGQHVLAGNLVNYFKTIIGCILPTWRHAAFNTKLISGAIEADDFYTLDI